MENQGGNTKKPLWNTEKLVWHYGMSRRSGGILGSFINTKELLSNTKKLWCNAASVEYQKASFNIKKLLWRTKELVWKARLEYLEYEGALTVYPTALWNTKKLLWNTNWEAVAEYKDAPWNALKLAWNTKKRLWVWSSTYWLHFGQFMVWAITFPWFQYVDCLPHRLGT